jgi:hypothetical protein
MKRGLPIALAFLVGALLPVVASAAPPVILSVGQVDRHPTAAWSLPAGVEARVVEVATNPAAGSDGYFFSENVKAFSVPQPTDTSWTYSYQLDPGTYYVHVAGWDTTCSGCPIREFSSALALVIPAPVVTPVVPVAPVVPTTPIATTITTRLTVNTKASSARTPTGNSQVVVQSSTVHSSAPPSVGRVKYTLSSPLYHKTQYGTVENGTDAQVTRFSHLEPGKYTLTAQYLGGADASVTFVPSAIVTRHFTIKAPAPRPLQQARLAGSFDVVQRFTSVYGIDLKVGSKGTSFWTFVPLCKAGVCNVRLTFRYGHASDVLRSPHTQNVPLKRNGPIYSGAARASTLECTMGNEVAGTLTTKLRVTKAAWISGKWSATGFTGSSRLAAPPATSGVFHCPAAGYTATLRGSLGS